MSTRRETKHPKQRPPARQAGRCELFSLEVKATAPAWVCDALKALSATLGAAKRSEVGGGAETPLPPDAPAGPRFLRRSKRGQTFALARRAAILAAEAAIARGLSRLAAVREGQAEHYRQTGATLSKSSFYVWETKARKAGGARTCALETFLDDRDVPHRRARPASKPTA